MLKAYFKENAYLIRVTVFLIFFTALLLGPIMQLKYLEMMPGDIGDARLNNYFLENVYQFFAGSSGSLWHLSFFSPFPYVLGFSDNLFGSAPIYLLARLLTEQSATAFQIWFLIGYAANFGAAYYALRCLGGSKLAAAVGALIFAFALPTTAHAGHAQLHYRFGVPLATVFFILFLDRKEFRLLTIAGAWLVWQFYCGIYMGFFTLLLLAIATVTHFFYSRYATKIPFAQLVRDYTAQWATQSQYEKFRVLLYIAVLLAVLALLFYPYLQVSHLYAAKRSWGEIATMLPRPQSYFLSDASYFWSSSASKLFAGIPMRHEHQMFFGVIPMLLAVLGFLIGSRNRNGHAFTLMTGVLSGVILLTLYIGGFSLWYILHKLPLASAIRAMTRLDQVLLFPVAYLAVIAIDYLRSHWQWTTKLIVLIILPLMIFEFSGTSMGVSPKNEWRDRLVTNEAAIPKKFPNDSILFFAQSKGPWYGDEIDAMWVSLNHSVNTLNGYSGLFPPGYTGNYGNDCSELPRRVLSYLKFSSQEGDNEAYLTLIKKIVPIGFTGCDERWMNAAQSITVSNREYTADEISKLTFEYVGKLQSNGQWVIELKILNSGDQTIAAASSVDKPIRLSWRFIDSLGAPMSGWDTRKDIPFDIPENGSLNLKLTIDQNIDGKSKSLQISLVQEGVFWAHDIGLAPLTIPLN